MHYLDPFTSVILPALVLVLGGLGLPGAAVYINRNALRSKAWQSGVAAAGPLMNLAVLLVVSLLLHVLNMQNSALGAALSMFAFLQASAVIFNLLPIPGFDGFAVIEPYLPIELRIAAMKAAPMLMLGFIALVMLIPAFSQVIITSALKLAVLAGINPYEAIEGIRAFRFWKQ